MIRTVAIALALLLVGSAAEVAAQPGPGSGAPDEDRDPGAPSPTPTPVPTPPEPTTEPTPPADGATPPVDGTTPALPTETPTPLAPAPRPAPPAPAVIAADVPGLTSGAWHASTHFALHWQLLMLPEQLVELLFSPIGGLVALTEKYRLDNRFDDLLELFDRRLVFAPRFKFSFGDGLGAGLWVKRPGLFDGRAELRVGGIMRLNGDWQSEIEYRHALLLPGGRGLRTRAFIERDKNQRFYGLGGASTTGDRRVLSSNDEGAVVEIDLQGIDRYTYSGIALVGIRRQTLGPGVELASIPVGGDGDTVVPPQGFDETALYVDLDVAGRYDTRDTVGRPVRGAYSQINIRGRSDVTGKNLSAITIDAGLSIYLPVIADHRTVILSLSTTAVVPLFDDARLPLDSLAVIGRSNVRGYDRERFRDKYGAVASIEYRFPVYEYLSSRAGLDAFTFIDVGEVWGTTKLSRENVRYSLGGGFRAAHETKMVMLTTFGWSPEGYQINLGVETAL